MTEQANATEALKNGVIGGAIGVAVVYAGVRALASILGKKNRYPFS